MGQPAVYLKKGSLIAAPASDEMALLAESDGSIKSLDSSGTRAAIGGGGSVPFAAVLARAQALLGPTITKAFGTDFDTSLWFGAAINVGTGTTTLSTTELGGVANLASGVNAASNTSVRPAGTAGLVTNPTTNLWYQRIRARISTAVDAQTYTTMAISGVAGSIGLFFGAVGFLSTVNFSYDFYNNAGASVATGSLGVALDTNFHVFELVGDGSFIDIYIDGTRRLHLAIPASMTNACSPRLDSGNGGTAANRQMNVDDLVICTAGA